MDKIAAGIVLFNPDIYRLKESIDVIIKQVDILILVDNNSKNLSEIENLYTNYSEPIILMKNNENKGIAHALNQIIHFCERGKYEWVVTLDQDSVTPNNLVASYKKLLPYDNTIGIITPRIIDRNYLEEASNSLNLPKYEYVEKCITSASFINVEICAEVGYFDDKMFIDLVDFEYCIRLRKAGFKILKINDVILIHQLGNLKVYKFFGKEIRITNHATIRHYYLTRNTLYFAKKHSDYFNKRKVFLNLCKKLIKVILFEDNKLKKLKAILIGIKDGYKMNLVGI